MPSQEAFQAYTGAIRPPRLKDIAQDLGVSMMTVSKALRGDGGVGAATRARVLARVREVGYQPNRAARALVTGRSHAIGLVVPDLVHPFFARIGRGLSRVLRPQHYSLIIASSDENAQLERSGIDVLVAQGIDALVVASVETGPTHLARLGKQRPLVLIDRRVTGLAAPFVGTDDREVGRLATLHLVEQGCTRIAHIRGGVTSPSVDRLAGYRAALTARRLPWRPELVIAARAPDLDGPGSGREAMRALLAVEARPDAVFCFNDPVAFGAMRAVLDAGLRIPEDIALIGCGNLEHDDLLRIPLSSIDQSCDLIGDHAGTLALDLLANPRRRKRPSQLVAPELVVRRSSQRR